MTLAKNLLRQALRRQLLIRSFHLFPRYVQIEPTAKCNLKCNTCMRSQSNPVNEGDMKFDLFKSIADQLTQPLYGTKVISLTGLGEPFTNPDLVQIVHYAKNKGLNIGMVTNLTLANEDILKGLIEAELDWLSVSVDGATKETFESIRIGAIFEEVIENIKSVVNLRKRMNAKKPKIFFSSVICEQNIHEIPEIIKLAHDLQIDGINFMKQAISGESYPEKPLLNPSLLKDMLNNVKIKVVFHLTAIPSCVAPRSCYITFDGKVLPCYPLYELVPRSKYSSYQFGDLKKQPFREIWFSPRYKKFRAEIINGMRLPICKSCPLGKI